jgi:hypothetical protein
MKPPLASFSAPTGDSRGHGIGRTWCARLGEKLKATGSTDSSMACEREDFGVWELEVVRREEGTFAGNDVIQEAISCVLAKLEVRRSLPQRSSTGACWGVPQKRFSVSG